MQILLHEYGLSPQSEHEERVGQYALQIFDFLAPDYALGASERNMLEMSAWFHDIGHVVSERKHDYHTRTLIAEDRVFDILPGKLRSTLAIIAGGHRKKICPSIDGHNKKRRALILKLAAILRVADAIDYYRRPDVTITSLDWNNDTVVITMEGSMLEYTFARIMKKGALFAEEFAPLRPEEGRRRM